MLLICFFTHCLSLIWCFDMRTIPVHKTGSAQLWSGRCAIKSCVHGGDGVNDYELAIYDCLGVPAGTEVQVIPKSPFDASPYGLNGSEKSGEADCTLGAYLLVTAIGGGAFGGSVNVTVDIIHG